MSFFTPQQSSEKSPVISQFFSCGYCIARNHDDKKSEDMGAGVEAVLVAPHTIIRRSEFNTSTQDRHVIFSSKNRVHVVYGAAEIVRGEKLAGGIYTEG